MPNRQSNPAKAPYRLRRASMDILAQEGWPKHDNLMGFMKLHYANNNLKGQYEREYPLLKAGKAVPRDFAEAFSRYMTERRHLSNFAFEEVFVSSVAELDESIFQSWNTMLNYLTERLSDHAEMYLQDPVDDPGFAARMIINSVGWKNAPEGATLDEEHCLSRGEQEMGIRREEYTEFLRRIWEREPRSIMFPIYRDGLAAHRVGASVFFPLSERAFRSLYNGEIREYDLTPDDMTNPSRLIYVHAMGEPLETPNITPRERRNAQGRCMLYQVGYFTRSIKPSRPKLLTIETNPQFAARLRRMGYLRTGKSMKGTERPFVLLQHKSRLPGVTVHNQAAYMVFQSAIRMSRFANREKWKEEDESPTG